MNEALEAGSEPSTPLRYELSSVNGRAYRVDAQPNGSERSTFLPVLRPAEVLSRLEMDPEAWMTFLQGCSFWWSAGKHDGLFQRDLLIWALDRWWLSRGELQELTGLSRQHIGRIINGVEDKHPDKIDKYMDKIRSRAMKKPPESRKAP